MPDSQTTVPDHEWEQLLAEAKERVGIAPVAAYLSGVGIEIGWPIPHERREEALRGLVRLVLLIEKDRRANER
jgi:hypothetical protein